MNDAAQTADAQPPNGGDSDEKGASAAPSIDAFVGAHPTRDLEAWAWLWHGDRPFPVRSERRGLIGRAVRAFKRLARPLLRLAAAELWDRQRVFNLILLEHIANAQHARGELDAFVRQVHRSHQDAIEAHAAILERLDRRTSDALTDIMRHNEALYAVVDQKLDRHRRETQTLADRLGSLVAVLETAAARPLEASAPTAGGGSDAVGVDGSDAIDGAALAQLAARQREHVYLDLETHYRGSEDDIAARIAVYLPYLADRPGPVLDLGCGRGEALRLMRDRGITVRGVDASEAMVARCRADDLDVVQGDLFDHLAAVAPESLGGVVAFHVIEHLDPDALARLVRLAWRALTPNGVLVLETPSPLSVVMSARWFWLDPTHRRPVHPGSLGVLYRAAGFAPVHQLDLHPFPDAQRLPEIDLGALDPAQHRLADQINRLRDALDVQLYGHRDFGLVGIKPSAPSSTQRVDPPPPSAPVDAF
ncbi:MAG: class I SAM-dependent methyltransferase [Acidobacteriota bacterium]